MGKNGKLIRVALVLFLSFVILACAPSEEPKSNPKASEGDYVITTNGRFVTVAKFKSAFLKINRNLVIYLPSDYETTTISYPVVYMHDGQNLYNDNDAAYGKAWNVDDAYDKLIKDELINPVIIVGINNTKDRIPEYTPTTDPEHLDGGQGENYCKFLVQELVPFINKKFRTKTGPENTAIIGSSLGGLISFYAGEKYPDTFGMAGCVSSSFWWNNEDLLKSIEATDDLNCKNVKFWIDAGTAEGSDTDLDGRVSTVEHAGRMAQKLLDLGWKENENLAFFEDVGKAHNEAAWEGRVGNILYFFFRKEAPALSSIETRLYMPKIGMNGLNKTWVSCDLIYENDFRLTKISTVDDFTANPADIIEVNNGRVTAKAIGNVNVVAKIGEIEAEAVAFEVVAELSENVSVTFKVTCPNSESSEIYMAGAGGPIPSENQWKPDGLESTKKISGTEYHFTFEMKRNSSFSFKFTRAGTWVSEEEVSSDRSFTNNGEDETVEITITEWKG